MGRSPLQGDEIAKEASQLSAVNRASYRAQNNVAAVGSETPAVFDPLPGNLNFAGSPFFARQLKFVSVMDGCGRIRLGAFTIQD